MKVASIFLAGLTLALSNYAFAHHEGDIEISKGRIKLQFRLKKDQSLGSFQLRSILEKHGFKNEGGFVRTREALAPLEIYNYLYEDGKYVFTIFVPVSDKTFAHFSDTGFLTFEGVAAQKLFESRQTSCSKKHSDRKPRTV
jgi:hypothetical protein